MDKAFKQVRDFHIAYEVPHTTIPGFPSNNRRILRNRLEAEEIGELFDADARNDLEGVADAAADLIYVVIGRCLEYGIPISEVFDEVQRSNMSKLGEDGKPIHREDGKVIKGPNFSPPDIKSILDKYRRTENGNRF